MKKIGFIGAYDKIDMIIYVAKILTAVGKKVLVIDATMNQKAKYVVPVISPTMRYVTEYEEIDIAVGFGNFEQIKQYLYLDEEKLPYDIVLVDSDNANTLESFRLPESNRNYFVTSFDNYSLKKGLEAFSTIREPMQLTKIIFSQYILKEENEYLDYLALGYKILWNEERVYFPMENGDLSVIYENQRISKIKFKSLSSTYKEGLAYLATEILEEIPESQIKKVIKILERGG